MTLRRFSAAALLAGLALAACQPIHREHTFDHQYPLPKRDFTLRWIGTSSGAAVWVSTANDGEVNGRYEGVQMVVDPGSPTDVESVVLPYLAENGVRDGGETLSYVVVTSADAQAIAGAERLAKEFPSAQVVAPGRPPFGGKGRGSGAPDLLRLGPEVSARLLKPAAAERASAQAIALRFIDLQFLLLPGHAEGLADAMAEELGERFEKEGFPTTLVYATKAATIDAHALEHLAPELLVGAATADGVFHYAEPKAGEALVITTNGSEMHGPGPRTRSRYGHWVDCSAAGERCGADLPVAAAGPVVIPVTLAGQDEGLFLVDTRAPFSYLARPRFQKIEGWEEAEGAGHSHGGGAIGLEVPAFSLGTGARKVTVHGWHVLPIDPFSIGGTPIAGVIGMDLLQSFRLELRPKERVLTWTPNFDTPRERLAKAESKIEGAHAEYDVPMDRSPNGPLILATMDGEPRSLIVDLAAERTRVYVRKDAWAAKVKESSKEALWLFDVPDEIDAASWKKYDLQAGTLTVKELNLFGAKFSDTPALAIDRPLDTDVLGLDFLQTFDRVSLDFRRRSILLEKG